MKHIHTVRETPIDRKSAALVGQLDAMMRRCMQREKRTQFDTIALTRQEYRLIDALGRDGGGTMGELGDRLVLAMSSLTGIVDKLAAKRLVTRRKAADDRRVVRVILTDLGRSLYVQCRQSRLRQARMMLCSLNEREQGEFIRLIGKIGADMRDQGGCSAKGKA